MQDVAELSILSRGPSREKPRLNPSLKLQKPPLSSDSKPAFSSTYRNNGAPHRFDLHATFCGIQKFERLTSSQKRGKLEQLCRIPGTQILANFGRANTIENESGFGRNIKLGARESCDEIIRYPRIFCFRAAATIFRAVMRDLLLMLIFMNLAVIIFSALRIYSISLISFYFQSLILRHFLTQV